jgi:hypothetical protein
MAIPEIQNATLKIVEKLLDQETPLFLRKLESINICPSLHMDVSTPPPTNLSISQS